MSDYDTQYMAVGDSAEPNKGGGIGWILGILLIIVVIIAVIFLILWLVNRNKNNTGELSITGARFTTPTPTSIQATWDKVGNDGNVVTMYVYPAGNKVLNFDTNGKPTNSSVITGTATTTSPNTTRFLSVTIPSNAANIIYSAALVVTNPNFAGANIERGSGLQPGGEITGAFLIRQNGQSVGEISYAIPGVNVFGTTGPTGPTGPSVFYNNNNFTSIDNILFHNDTPGVTGATGGGGYLCTVMPSQIGVINIDPTTQCTDIGNSYGLYDTGTTTLGIAPMTGATDTNPTLNPTNAHWTYTTNNQWCLSSNNTRCFNLATPRNSGRAHV